MIQHQIDEREIQRILTEYYAKQNACARAELHSAYDEMDGVSIWAVIHIEPPTFIDRLLSDESDIG